MRYWFFIFLILVVAIVQASVIRPFCIWGAKPDLLFSVVVIVSILLGFRQAFIFSIACGIFKDLLGVSNIAVNTFMFPICSFLIMQAMRKISLEGRYRQAVFILIVTAMNILVSRLLFFSTTIQIPLGIFIRTFLFDSVLTALAAQGAILFISSRFSLSETLKSDTGPDLEAEI